MLSGKTIKITLCRIKYIFRNSNDKDRLPIVYNILVQWKGADFEVVVKFMVVFVTRREPSYF